LLSRPKDLLTWFPIGVASAFDLSGRTETGTAEQRIHLGPSTRITLLLENQGLNAVSPSGWAGSGTVMWRQIVGKDDMSFTPLLLLASPPGAPDRGAGARMMTRRLDRGLGGSGRLHPIYLGSND